MAKAILGAVGRGCRKRLEDVAVTYILNCVPTRQGGPEAELALDGLCGPIRKVTEHGDTFVSLIWHDPYPYQNLNLPAPRHDAYEKQIGAKSGMAKIGGGARANSWDPWGYHKPGGENYRKQRKEPQ